MPFLESLKDVYIGTMPLSTLFGALITFLVCLIVISIILKLVSRALNGAKKMGRTMKNFLLSAVKIALWVIAVIIIAGELGIPTASLVALLSVAGLALSLSVQGLLGNLFSGLIMILWNSGIQILIFLAGLQKVPRTLYEAAKIDGASGWESFWKITLPTVKPLVLLNSIYTVVTLATGGTNEIIELIYNATYTATQGYSYAMAMSWIYTLVIAVILVIVFLLLKEKSDKHVVYEQKRVRQNGVTIRQT